MNSSESSVIVLDSDDEEDQSKTNISKTAQMNSHVVPRFLTQAFPPKHKTTIRNNVTPSSNLNNQIDRAKNTSISQLSSSTKKISSVSITPLSQTSNINSAINKNSQAPKNPQVFKISPLNSPRNSPNLKVKNNNLQSKSDLVTSANCHIQSNTTITSSLEKQLFEKYGINTKSSPKVPVKSILKRKHENTSNNKDFETPNTTNQITSSNFKRIKPVMISSSVNPKWTQSLNTITIDDDDDDYLESSLKSQQFHKLVKSRSNSITSSSASSPSSTTSSTATSPHSQSYSTTSSPSLKDLNRRSNTPKGSSLENISEDHPKNCNIINLPDKNVSISEKPAADPVNISTFPLPNGKINIEDNIEGKQKNEIIPAFQQLIEACKNSEKSSEMEILIEKKLLKYYHSIHPDFITSKSFKKTVEDITNEILETPNLVYIKLKTIIEELKSRKNSKIVVVSNDGQTSTGNDEVDEQVRKLNKGLRKLKHIINKLEEEEVDWDNDCNSAYLKVERFKKRACEIYEKICDLTGESKHAQRTVRKPIIFDYTAYPKINKAIETFVNKTRTFPDFQDILTILQYCNKNSKLDLTSEEIKRLAQDAFVKVGKLLQNRRKTDLYETLSHYTEKIKDPALEDVNLNAKLNENKKHYGKINAIIQKYAREQDTLQSDKLKAKDILHKKNVNSESPNESNDDHKATISDSSKEKNEDNKLKENIDLSSDKIKMKQTIITEEMRNTPCCSHDLGDNESNVKISDNNENVINCEALKKGNTNKENNNTSNNNNNTNNSNNKDNNGPSNINCNKDINSNNSKNLSINSESNSEKLNNSNNRSNNNNNSINNNMNSLKIINVTSLCEQTKNKSMSISTSLSEKDRLIVENTLRIKSIETSSLANKNKVNFKGIEIDEIILSDDDV